LLSAWSGPIPSGVPAINDKLVHGCLYAVLGWTLGYGWTRGPGRFSHAWMIAIGALYGATDEWHQIYVSGRVADVGDWFADLVGLVRGYGVALFVLRQRGDDGSGRQGEGHMSPKA